MNLANAISLASVKHKYQMDKGGKPYILHPMRVMMRLRTDDEELMSIAIMHDLIEDTNVDATRLYEMGFSTRVVEGVLSVTRLEDETYDHFIQRAALNKDGRLVKLEDLRDNSDITRLKGLTKKDFNRIEKYQKAFTYLSKV